MADPEPARRLTPPQLIPSSRAARLGLLAIALGAGLSGWTLLSALRDAEPPANRPIRVPTGDFVTAESCRPCHPGNHASWHASYHRTMTQVAKPGNFAAEMDGLQLTHEGTDYRIERQGDAYFALTKPANAPFARFASPRQIVMLTGSHNLQVCWLATGAGRSLEQLPFTYLVAEKRWVPANQSFLIPPSVQQTYGPGDWNEGCILCHVTQGRARPAGGTTFDSQVAEFGISCASCHGEGREHIEQNRNPLRRLARYGSGQPDPTIANPARMDGPAATLVCGQCHSFQAFDNPTAAAVFQKHGTSFRPGMKALDGRSVILPGNQVQVPESAGAGITNPHSVGNSFWGDGMIRVTGRETNGVMASPCFRGNKFSCLSCHELHPERIDAGSLEEWKEDHQMRPGLAESDQACLQCHPGIKAKQALHTRHAADSSGSRCYNCHMPHTTYGLLRALRSHQVSSPSVRESTELGRPNACNLCHLDQPLSWTAGWLHQWYGQKAPPLSEDESRYSSGAQWLLKGDAGQRGLVVWSMGWAPAQKASGTEWMYPYLIMELNDPYAVVRFAAGKALQTLPRFENLAYDYAADDEQQKAAADQAYQKWWNEVRDPARNHRAQTILEPSGEFRQDVFDRMLRLRSQRQMLLAE